jgi:hypothetical protein
MSKSFNDCKHTKSYNSPDGIDKIAECSICCKAWLVKGITGEVIEIYGSTPNRLLKQAIERTRHINTGA